MRAVYIKKKVLFNIYENCNLSLNVRVSNIWEIAFYYVKTNSIASTQMVDQSCIYSPTDSLVSCLKKTILKFTLKFTLKQLRHVSALQLHHHQGTH